MITNSRSSLTRRAFGALVAMTMLTAAVPSVMAQGKKAQTPATLDLIPRVTEVVLNSAGQLVANGNVEATVRGVTTLVPFENIPVTLARATDQTGAQAGCPILDLSLGPINLNLLGLVVETSEICLKITAYDGAGLLGDLLCSLSNALNGTTPLATAINNLNVGDRALLFGVLDQLISEALNAISGAVLQGITPAQGRMCEILNLELAPVDLTLLGLNVHLDNCNNGPITVDVSARRGQLLGNLLCGLLQGGSILDGATLGDIVDGLLGRLNR
jgi:hypothetical protein